MASQPSISGSLESFEALYRREVSPITAFFARRTSDPEIVADLTADTFVEAIRSFRSYDSAKGGERAWVYGIARRVYAKHCERAARREDATRRYAARAILDEDGMQELSERIDAEAPGRALLTRLESMSLIERDAIELVDLAGLRPAEAASVLGVAPGVMRVRLLRARARLRKGSDDGVSV